jgi:hypothetical protein
VKRTTLICRALLGLSTIAVSLLLMEQTAVVLSALAAGILAFAMALVATISGIVRHSFVRRAVGGFIITIVLIVSVALWHWPFRAAYALSRPALERAATEVRAGHSFEGRRVGVFLVRRAEVSRTGIVCLWVDTNPSGRTGFVQTPPQYVPFNLWSQISLDAQWQFISED